MRALNLRSEYFARGVESFNRDGELEVPRLPDYTRMSDYVAVLYANPKFIPIPEVHLGKTPSPNPFIDRVCKLSV